jgi:predicted small lipoprotein YifL
MKTIICAFATLLLVVGFSGCGQSGPLYVPGDPSSIKAPPKAEASDEKEEDENGEDADSP